MNLSELKVDVEAIEAGEWVYDIPGLGDIGLHVRGVGNKDWRELEERLLLNVRQCWEAMSLPEGLRRISASKQTEILNRLLVETALLDWRNVEDGGEPVVYSRELAAELINDPEFSPFRDGVLLAAQRVGRKQVDAAPVELESITIETMKSPASDGPGYIRDNRGQIQEPATPRRRGRTRRKSAPAVTAEPMVIESL